MTLRQLLVASDVAAHRLEGDAPVTGVQLDSRRCAPGTLFVCMPGMTNDSQTFIPAAAAAGASSVVAYSVEGFESAVSAGLAAALIRPDELKDAIWRICDAHFDHPTRHMKVVGVTGTNGKTTTAWLVRDILESFVGKCAYLGTLGFHLPGEKRVLTNTTPYAVELYNLLDEARSLGVEALAMEVSSHALEERRADGVEFDVGVFTNLTQDHLDFHGDMASYEAAKRRLFTELPKQTKKSFRAAINVGDPSGARWAAEMAGDRPLRYRVVPKLLPYGAVGEGSDLDAAGWEVAVDHIHLVFESRTEGDHGFVAPLGGSYNVENLTSAVAAAIALGYPGGDVQQAALSVTPVPGRFEAVPNDRGLSILVDYAHTPDALEKLLDAVRPLTAGKVITVFGCGGDRDRTKRPRMARAASERSDMTVVTSDNPRTEDPQAILDDVLPGIVPGRASVCVIDRREAVAHAVGLARPGDVVVIAGKGHEDYQIIGRTKFHMDDRELAREALERLV